MRRSAALASSLIAGFSCLAGSAAGTLTGTKPMMPPASNPPKTAMCRTFTTLSPSKSASARFAEREPTACWLCTFENLAARMNAKFWLTVDPGLTARTSQPLSRRGQPLAHEMPVVIGRVVEPPELLVTQLFVETGRLKTKRVQPCRVTAALAGKDFRSGHQLAPDTAAAQSLGHP